jgi:hypothetical protein
MIVAVAWERRRRSTMRRRSSRRSTRRRTTRRKEEQQHARAPAQRSWCVCRRVRCAAAGGARRGAARGCGCFAVFLFQIQIQIMRCIGTTVSPPPPRGKNRDAPGLPHYSGTYQCTYTGTDTCTKKRQTKKKPKCPQKHHCTRARISDKPKTPKCAQKHH